MVTAVDVGEAGIGAKGTRGAAKGSSSSESDDAVMTADGEGWLRPG